MTVAWSALILLSLLLYVLLDGYDLGIGIGTLFERDPRDRREMLEEVSFAWDGNESWLVLLVVALWAGFPLAFGAILPHAYLAVIVALSALIVRGVSIEMASQTNPAHGWVRAFGVSSLVAALAQGVALATLTSNLTVTNGAFAGSAFGAIGWYSALAAVTVACLYLAAGYAYLKGRTKGALRARVARGGLVATTVGAALIAASLGALAGTAAPLNLDTAARAFGFAGLLLFAVAGLVLTLVTMRASCRADTLPYAGLGIAVVAVVAAVVEARAPVIAPPSLTVGNSVSPGTTMAFLAVGIGLNLPLILFYTWYAHRAFKGRTDSVGAEL